MVEVVDVAINLYQTLYVVVVAPEHVPAKPALRAFCKLGCTAGLEQLVEGVREVAVKQVACVYANTGTQINRKAIIKVRFSGFIQRIWTCKLSKILSNSQP